MGSQGEQFEKLAEIVRRLRDPQSGCPWDREQTHQSLKRYLIEESYEAIDAIDHAPAKLADELGDVLLQVMLHSEIARQDGRFDISTVVEAISRKMVERHPHVFGDTKVHDSAEVLRNWEQNKKKQLAPDASILDGVPRSMPALLRGQRIGEKAARVGFEWNTTEEVRDKVFEEMREFLECCTSANEPRERIEEEFGDLLFALTQLGRRLQINSEELLGSAIDKFTRRFREIERRLGPDLKAAGLEKMDAVWNEVKEEERRRK